MACQSQTSEGLGNASIDRRTAFVDDIETGVCDIVVLQLILTLDKGPDQDGMILRGDKRDGVQPQLRGHDGRDEG